ncbi:unnamed protein product [Lymnaea stagnalis]|uniref:Ribonuclease H2 subunit B n=1 Tax=Lymnaea stagnalis TaxID=6523 RepID=A0AAV2IE73_LYMST
MPRPTRGKGSKSDQVKQEEHLQRKNDQWIFIVNDEVLNGSCSKDGNNPSLCKLRHPRLNSGVMYLVSDKGTNVFELNAFKEKFRSWFIGETVQRDGDIYFTTPVDPLFLVLPYLINAGENNRYMAIDQIVLDEEFPECHKLSTCFGKGQLELITDWKEIDDEMKVYRYNKEKCMAWLKSKTEAVADALEKKNVQVSTKGSHSAIFIRSKDTDNSRESYLEFAHGVVSDYLALAVEKELKTFLGLPEVNESASTPENEPPSKKVKLSTDVKPLEDYSIKLDTKKDKSKTGKQSAAQKQLSKVDKSGMKSMMSFFSPKS